MAKHVVGLVASVGSLLTGAALVAATLSVRLEAGQLALGGTAGAVVGAGAVVAALSAISLGVHVAALASAGRAAPPPTGWSIPAGARRESSPAGTAAAGGEQAAPGGEQAPISPPPAPSPEEEAGAAAPAHGGGGRPRVREHHRMGLRR